MIWLKFLHVAAIAIWSAGLICLPGLYVQRAHVANQDSVHRLQAMVRFLYVAVVSPAAFLSVGSGTALIFVRESFEPWFSLKLALIGGMVVTHILTGLVIIRLFEDGNVYPAWRFIAVTGLTVLIIASVLTVVLAKPDLPNVFPDVMSRPGGLAELLEPINPFGR
ncbi:CopD family protein [Mesorhizobium sp. CAU 1741]|uniref:CopD family protein n=1 Tax=Mesorhizobium sp. CAU 1741 TaxID=3140366 RepID=UPI00325AC2E3